MDRGSKATMIAKSKPLADSELVRRFNERNCKDWCRGTNGIEHNWQWRDRDKYRGDERLARSEEKVCTKCGKRSGNRTKSYSPGFLIRHFRELREMSQDQLATAAKLDATRVMGIENGAIEVRVKELCAIAEALKVELEVSIGGNNVESHRSRWMTHGYEVCHYERVQHAAK